MNVMAALNSAMPAPPGPASAPGAAAGATGLGGGATGATDAGGNVAGGAATSADPGAQLLALLEALVPGGLEALGREAGGDATAADGLTAISDGAEPDESTDEPAPLPSDPGLTASVFAALAGMARAQLAPPAGSAAEGADPSALSVGAAASGSPGVTAPATDAAAGSAAVGSAGSAALVASAADAAAVADVTSEGAVIDLGAPAVGAAVSAPVQQPNLADPIVDATESVDLTASAVVKAGGNANASGESESDGAGAEGDSSLPRPTPINQVVAHRASTPAAEVQAARSVEVPDQDPNVPRLTGAIRSMSRGGVQTTSLTLNPESLGAVRVDLHHQNGHLSVHLSAESVEGTEVLNRASGALRSELERSGLGATNVSVDVSTGGQQGRSTNWSADDSSTRGFAEPGGSGAPSTATATASTAATTRSVSRPGRGAEGLDLSL